MSIPWIPSAEAKAKWLLAEYQPDEVYLAKSNHSNSSATISIHGNTHLNPCDLQRLVLDELYGKEYPLMQDSGVVVTLSTTKPHFVIGLCHKHPSYSRNGHEAVYQKALEELRENLPQLESFVMSHFVSLAVDSNPQAQFHHHVSLCKNVEPD